MLQIRETMVNVDRGYQFGDSGWYEPFTSDRGRLFKALQKEYGRCASKMYCDPDARPVGWVFERKEKYEDTNELYTREVWVELREKEDGE